MARRLTFVVLSLTVLFLAAGESAPVQEGESGNWKNEYVPQAGDRLPDLVPLAPERVYYDEQCYREDGDQSHVVCFDALIANLGRGPLELVYKLDGDVLGQVYQKIYNDGKRRRVKIDGGFYYHDHVDHQHNHFKDFARYKLFVRNKDGSRGALVADSDKVSFFLVDNIQLEPDLDPEGQYTVKLTGPDADRVQGISVGWADLYSADIEGQALDIDDVPPGRYILQLRTDPRNRIAEHREHNNVVTRVVQIRADGTLRFETPFR